MMERRANLKYLPPEHGGRPVTGTPIPEVPTDPLTVIRQLFTANIEALNKMAAAIASLSHSDTVLKETNQGFIQPVTYQDINITNAQTDLLVTFPPCKWVQATADGDLTGITIKLSTQSEQAISIKNFDTLPVVNATRLYVTNTAVPGRTNLRLTFSWVEPAHVTSLIMVQSFSTTPAVNIYTSATPPAAATVYSTMVDARNLRNMLLYVTNTSDVAVTVQLIGNITATEVGAARIGAVIPVVATTGIETIGLDLAGDDWHPYIGLEIIIPAGATVGAVTVNTVNRT